MQDYENMELSGSEVVPEKDETPAVETPTDTETPSEEVPEKTEETPEVDPTEEAPVVEDDGLFELPDGRRVTAAEAQREWKENFLPEFTRKSQELARLKSGDKDITSPSTEMKKEWKDPDYVPKSYAEIVEIAKAEAIQEIREQAKAEEARIETIKSEIDAAIADIKKIDPKLDENALFNHANKYGFQDLKAAHQNMRDMQKVAVHTEQKVLKNVKTRESDPVSDAASPVSKEDDSFDPKTMSQFDSASDFLAFLKNKK